MEQQTVCAALSLTEARQSENVGEKQSLLIPSGTHFRHPLSSTSSSYFPVTAFLFSLLLSPCLLHSATTNMLPVMSPFFCVLVWSGSRSFFLLFCLCLSTERAVDMKWQKYVIRHVRASQRSITWNYIELSQIWFFFFNLSLSPVCFNHFICICLLFFHGNVQATWVQFGWAQQLEARLHATISFCTSSSGCRALDSGPPRTHSGKSTRVNSASISINNIYMPLYAILFHYRF